MENKVQINIPKMMTIRQIARTGLLPENALRVMVKNGEIPAVYSGTKAFINFENLCLKLSRLGREEVTTNVEISEGSSRNT